MKLAASISPWADFPLNCKIQWQKTSDSDVVVQSLSRVCLFVSPWTAACQAFLSFIISQSLLRVTQLSWWCYLTILSSGIPFSSCTQPFPAQNQGLFLWVSCSHQVAKVLELQLQHQPIQWIFWVDFLKDWLVWSPCSPRDSQESSLTPQFKCQINK